MFAAVLAHANVTQGGAAVLLSYRLPAIVRQAREIHRCRLPGRHTATRPVRSRRMTLRVQRRLLAILAADVAGYAALMESQEEDTYARVTELQTQVIEPCIRDHRGRIVKRTG